MKREFFFMFLEIYSYNGKEMYFLNIVSDYIKKVIKLLNSDGNGILEFRIWVIGICEWF